MAFEGDWIFLKTAVPELQEYILSNELYWTLRPVQRAPGGVQVPQLSIGNLQLSQARLAARSLSSSEQAELSDLQRSIEAVRSEWRANWGRKADQEFQSRLNLWQQYLRELRDDAKPSAVFYAREVRNRAILQLLQTEMSGAGPENEQLRMLDGILRGVGRPGPFVWELELAGGFGQAAFWFLYLDVTK
jgi:hypothetical protein